MPSPLRHLAAILTRLKGDATLTALVPAGSITMSFLFTQAEVTYPCVVVGQSDGNRGVWSANVLDPATLQIDCYDKVKPTTAATIAATVANLLHKQEQQISTSEACVKECRVTWQNSPMWDDDVNAWRVTTRFLIRVFDVVGS